MDWPSACVSVFPFKAIVNNYKVYVSLDLNYLVKWTGSQMLQEVIGA